VRNLALFSYFHNKFQVLSSKDTYLTAHNGKTRGNTTIILLKFLTSKEMRGE